ncbi:MAG: chorismate mutase, partial [Burkholderiaceae bacterium]|nr:chorismate mutase [Burkholderiaceae bacterium]
MSNDDQRLAPLRAQIDAIDQELLELISKRAKAAQEVGHIKNESSAPIFRPERENQVIQNVLQKNPGPLLADGLASIWREIMSACRALESKQTIAYLGPTGTFSEQAAHQFFGQSISGLPCVSLDEVFKAV